MPRLTVAASWQDRRALVTNVCGRLAEISCAPLPEIDAAAQSDQECLRHAGRYLSAWLRGTYRPDTQVYVASTQAD